MRTNIVIADKLMRETLRVTGLKTKREAVELGLETLLPAALSLVHDGATDLSHLLATMTAAPAM